MVRGLRGRVRLSEGGHGKDVSTPDTCSGGGWLGAFGEVYGCRKADTGKM